MPTGTVTFLFTDIEGSTRAWQDEPGQMAKAVAAHDDQLRSCIEAAGGHVFALGGDSFAAAFATVDSAVEAAVAAQDSLGGYQWPTSEPIRVRMGIHAGSAEERAGNYFGPTVNMAARLMSAGHGGQVLLSETASSLLRTRPALVHLGERRLDDVLAPVMVHQLGDRRFPPLRAVNVFLCDVPVARTELIGREQELSVIDQSLHSARLVTLVGAGGSGKTRLAFEAARAVQAQFEAGVRLVDLAAVADATGVGPSIATAVDAASGADAVAAIGKRETLLVVDNCEHVIDEIADHLDELLSSCPNLKVIATSREPLEIDGEVIYAVPPLDPAGAATDLFRARVEAAGMDPNHFDASDVSALCARLDGLPLAVELAAGRARTLNPSEMIERLDAGVDLEGGRRRRRRRHETLEATIAWSYDLLAADERRVLLRSAVFESEFPLAGIETTSGLSRANTLVALDGLVAKSLMVRVWDAGGSDASRYRLLETVRDFAGRRLGVDDDPADAQDRLVDYMVSLFDDWLAGTSRPELLDEIVAQLATIASAAHYAEHGDRLDAFGDILQIWMLAWLCVPTAGRPDVVIDSERIERLPDEVRGTLFCHRSIVLLNLGDIDGCLRNVSSALALAGGRDTVYAATALSIRARMVAYVDPEAALALAESSQAMRSRADEGARAALLGGDVSWMFEMHDYASVLTAAGQTQAAWETLLDAARLGIDVNPLAHHMLLTDVLWTSILMGRPDEGLARAAVAGGAELRSARRWPTSATPAPIAHAAALAAAGDVVQAQRSVLATIESWEENPPSSVLLPTCLVALGIIAFHEGDDMRATLLLEPTPKSAMSVLMLRRHYRERLGITSSSARPLESASEVDSIEIDTKGLVDAELKYIRRSLTEQWDGVATGWEARRTDNESNLAPVTDWLIDRLAPQSGQIVLDLAAGAGGLGHRVAELIGSSGRVLLTDVAPEMVDAARRLGTDGRFTNVEYQTLDAEQMVLDDDSVDAVMCRSGLMVMTDPLAALRQVRRVLRPDGRFVFSVFTTAAANPWIAVPGSVFADRGHILRPEPGPPGVFSMGDPNLIRDWVRLAGFSKLEIDAVDFVFRYDDGDDLWEMLATINSVLAPTIEQLTVDERNATRTEVLAGLDQYRSSDGSYVVPARTWCVLAS